MTGNFQVSLKAYFCPHAFLKHLNLLPVIETRLASSLATAQARLQSLLKAVLSTYHNLVKVNYHRLVICVLFNIR